MSMCVLNYLFVLFFHCSRSSSLLKKDLLIIYSPPCHVTVTKSGEEDSSAATDDLLTKENKTQSKNPQGENTINETLN